MAVNALASCGGAREGNVLGHGQPEELDPRCRLRGHEWPSGMDNDNKEGGLEDVQWRKG